MDALETRIALQCRGRGQAAGEAAANKGGYRLHGGVSLSRWAACAVA